MIDPVPVHPQFIALPVPLVHACHCGTAGSHGGPGSVALFMCHDTNVLTVVLSSQDLCWWAFPCIISHKEAQQRRRQRQAFFVSNSPGVQRWGRSYLCGLFISCFHQLFREDTRQASPRLRLGGSGDRG